MIANAINDAHERGVRVRYITCELQLLQPKENFNMKFFRAPELMGIMHNKLTIDDIADMLGYYGSTNWTIIKLFDDPNHIIMVQDQSVARAYEIEFNEMWGSDGDQYDLDNAKFGSDKTNNTPHHFIVNGNDFEVYFSPSDNTTYNISNALKTANNEIDFVLWFSQTINLGVQF